MKDYKKNYSIEDFGKPRIFEAYYGASFGPKEHYYIELDDDKFILKYHNPEHSLIKTDDELKVSHTTFEEIENFINNLLHMTTSWEYKHFDDNIIDSSDWYILSPEYGFCFSGNDDFPDNFSDVMALLHVFFTQNIVVEETPNVEKKNIKITLKNTVNSYAMRLSCYPSLASITFINKNHLSNLSIMDTSCTISIAKYEEFIARLTRLTKNWEHVYNGDSTITWSLTINDNDETLEYKGNGAYPENWNNYIDLLVEYEIILKKENNKK